jgi:hypothetical protein
MAAVRHFSLYFGLQRQLTNLWTSSRQTGQDVGNIVCKSTVKEAATTTNSEAIYKLIAHKRALVQYVLQKHQHKITKIL